MKDIANHRAFLKEQFSPLLDDYSFEEVYCGESDANVLRLTNRQLRVVYLKYAFGAPAQEVQDEHKRLLWLYQHAQAPKVLSYTSNANGAFLLTDALHGRNALDVGLEDPEPIVLGMGRALRHLHSIPIENCPFNQNLSVQLELAHARMRAGLINEDDFDGHRQGLPSFDLYQQLLQRKPFIEDLVITHGDACPENFIFNENRFQGFVDCVRVGVSDKYQDLALASRNIRSIFGELFSNLFFDAYGESNPDREKLDYYCLLDEFF